MKTPLMLMLVALILSTLACMQAVNAELVAEPTLTLNVTPLTYFTPTVEVRTQAPPRPSPTLQVGEGEKMVCVSEDVVNLRDAPNGKDIGDARRGEKMRFLSSEGAWRQVVFKGSIYWIAAWLVEPCR